MSATTLDPQGLVVPCSVAASSIPALVLFQGGRKVARQSGAQPASAILQFIGAHVKSSAGL